MSTLYLACEWRHLYDQSLCFKCDNVAVIWKQNTYFEVEQCKTPERGRF